MKESKRNMADYLARLDRHVVQLEEYEDISEFTDEFLDKADVKIDGELIRRGRPKMEKPKRQITLRLDSDIIEGFQAGGAGWQSRINDALRRALGLKENA